MNWVHLSIVISVGIVASLYGVIFSNPYVFLWVSTILSVSFILKSKLDLTNPDVWFVTAVNAYHLSVYALDYLGLRVVENKYELIFINFLALLGYFTASTILYKKTHSDISIRDDISMPRGLMKIIVLALFLLTLLVPISFLASGATQKADFNNQFVSIFGIFNFSLILLIIKTETSKNLSYIIGLVILYLFTASLILGERDVFYSFILAFVFLESRRTHINKAKLVFICVFLVVLIPILGEFKNIFTRDSVSVERDSLVVSLLNGEFRSAGYNIDHILGNNFDFKYGESIINDLVRSVVPGFLHSVENSVSWYNNTFHPDIVAQGRGYGFSLAAEGYVNFGYFGVFLWFLIISLGIVNLYNKSFHSTFYLAIYLTVLPVCIYVLRGDFSTILSPLLKQIMIPYLIMFLFFRFSRSFKSLV
jgi:oligosaccharide repeat unit polymerase